jgi:hypothetical protein
VTCAFRTWPVASPNPQFTPLIAHGSGRWLVRWLEHQAGQISVQSAELFGSGSGSDNLVERHELATGQAPCMYDDDTADILHYWGHYDDLVWLGRDGGHANGQRFYTTFTRNGPDCTPGATWTAPMDVWGASVF